MAGGERTREPPERCSSNPEPRGGDTKPQSLHSGQEFLSPLRGSCSKRLSSGDLRSPRKGPQGPATSCRPFGPGTRNRPACPGEPGPFSRHVPSPGRTGILCACFFPALSAHPSPPMPVEQAEPPFRRRHREHRLDIHAKLTRKQATRPGAGSRRGHSHLNLVPITADESEWHGLGFSRMRRVKIGIERK